MLSESKLNARWLAIYQYASRLKTSVLLDTPPKDDVKEFKVDNRFQSLKNEVISEIIFLLKVRTSTSY